MKKFISIIAAVFICACVFAQNAKSTGLTDSDVQSFCKNYNKIYTELEKVGVVVTDTESLVLSASAQVTVNKVLNKYGVSGNNAYDKVVAIAYGYAVGKYDETLAADPQTAALMKTFGMDPMAQIRSMVAESDQKVVDKNMAALTKVFDEEIAPEVNEYSGYDTNNYSDLSAIMNAFTNAYSAAEEEEDGRYYSNKNKKLTQEVLKKYDTKKKFKVEKERYGDEWIIVQPTDITFENSDEAFIYAENYTGVPGHWEAANSFGYLGGKAKKGDKPLYVWLVDGVGIYKNFPVDFDGGAPDELIPNEKVTPAIAKKAVLQMYKLQNE